MDRVALITSIVFMALVSVRTLLSLVAPRLHHATATRFYNRPGKRYGYLALALYGAIVLAGGASPAYLVVGYMTVGALYDYFFTLFPEQSRSMIEEGERDRGRLWVFAYAVPLAMVILLALQLGGVLPAAGR